MDRPVSEHGLWRLSIEDNYAYHMGNTIESWMSEVFDKIDILEDYDVLPINLVEVKRIKSIVRLQRFLFNKFLSRKIIWTMFLRFKGLSKEVARNY